MGVLFGLTELDLLATHHETVASRGTGSAQRGGGGLALLLVVGILVGIVAAGWYAIRWLDDRNRALSPADTIPAGAQEVEAVRVRDGDTIEIRASTPGSVIDTTEVVHARLLGIDAPELHGSDGRAQCYATASAGQMRRLVRAGERLWVTADQGRRDPYDRYLVYAWTRAGTFVNLNMAQGGYARPLHIPPNNRYNREIDAAVAAAKQANRGLWAVCPQS